MTLVYEYLKFWTDRMSVSGAMKLYTFNVCHIEKMLKFLTKKIIFLEKYITYLNEKFTILIWNYMLKYAQ